MAMTVVPRRQLYLSALSILCIVLLLLVMISISTVQNLNRERNAATETVYRQALTLIKALEAGARAGMMMQMAGADAIGTLIHEVGRSDDIHYLYLVNAAGLVVHHSTPSLEGSQAVWRPPFQGSDDVRTRVRRLDDGTLVFEIAKPFAPMGAGLAVPGMPTKSAGREAAALAHESTRAIVYLGMNMTAYETARRSDLHHAAIMGGIVLALGAGVIYFFIVLRSYHLLSRTLRETRDYTRQVIASMAHGVMSIDTQGRLVSYNRQALSLLGIAASAAAGFDLGARFAFDATGIARTLAAGVPVLNHEMTVAGPSGQRVPVAITVTPIQDEAEKVQGAVVVVRDMRAIKRLEQQVRRAEKLAAIGKLAAGVAHEIRNPLSSIRGFAYLLGRNHGEAAPEREYADVMVREIDRINQVVTNLLNFASPMTAAPAPTDLSDLINHVAVLVAADADKQQIDIHMDVPPDLPSMTLDPDQVTQAMLNLLLNAIVAAAPGGRIDIRACRAPDHHAVTILIEDDGPGIVRDLQEKIFEPFFTTRGQGTGLGLAMVRKIAENHDGRVTVESPPPEKSRGSRFVLVLRNIQAGGIHEGENSRR
jgi:two-component system sensor histidine kinase HydH